MPHDKVLPVPVAGSDSRNSALLPYIVAATFFMEYLDTTIIATALPQMARSFSTGPNQVSLGMTSYMLTLAVFIPVSGWIADRFGSRTVFGCAVVIFTLASILCGFSTGLASFTAARVLQGIGGAMMVPVGRMIVVRNTEKARLMKAITTTVWPGVVAPVVGPTIGGFITTYASWRWIFFLNVPFGIAALVAIAIYVPQQKGAARKPLDLPGFFLSGLTLISLLYGTELASDRGANLYHAGLFLLAGIVIGIIAVRHAFKAAHPMLDLTAVRVQTFAASAVWGSATRIGIEAVPYLLPLLFQIGFGLSAFRSGLLMLASATGNLGMKLFTTQILRRFGFRTVAIIDTCIAAAFTAACGWLTPDTPLGLMCAVLLIYGLSRSMQFTTLATLAYADVNEAQKGPASTLISVTQQMALGMGIAFGALALRISASLLGSDPGGRFSLFDFRLAFALAGALTLGSVIGYLRLPYNAGSNISGHRR